MKAKTVFRISFVSHNKIYEVYARSVVPANLLGFIEVSDFIFGDATQVVVDPAEERLKHEFTHVKSSYIPMHAILRIDQVQKEGTAKITSISPKDSNISYFPNSLFNTHDKPEKNS